MLAIKHFSGKTLKGDLFGGITSTIIALPFALAFGVTSGAGASAGIYCAILTGFFGSLFGGTNAQISGPNTGLTVAMAAVLTSFVATDPENGFAAAFTVVMLAGVIQMMYGFLKLGKYFILVSYPVISGFTSGIGILIILSQLEPLLGFVPGTLSTDNASQNLMSFNALIGFGSLLILYCWPQMLERFMPSGIVVLTIMTFLYVGTGAPIPVVGAIPDTLPSIQFPVWSDLLTAEMIKSAILLATLSTLDSLMTSLTVDSISNDIHDSDQELIGQGIGNIFAGLFGALPGGGGAMRSVANFRAGGTTPLSGILHALFILLIVMWAGEYTAFVPLAVLAAIMVKVGIDLIDWNFLLRIHRVPLFSAGLMMSTMVMAVFVDLVTSVLVGVFVANLVTIRRLSEIQLDNVKLCCGKDDEDISEEEKQILQQFGGGLVVLHISGPLSFGVSRGLKQSVSQVQNNHFLLMDFTDARFVGITSTIAVEEIIHGYSGRDKTVLLCGVNDKVRKGFDKLKLLDEVTADHIFETRAQAFEYAQKLEQRRARNTRK